MQGRVPSYAPLGQPSDPGAADVRRAPMRGATLPPGQRSAELAMQSFLKPISEVFAFLEDAMTVQVGYALATGNNRRVNALLNIAVWGGAFFGMDAPLAAPTILQLRSALRTKRVEDMH